MLLFYHHVACCPQHARTTFAAVVVENYILSLSVCTVMAFVIDTLLQSENSTSTSKMKDLIDQFQFVSSWIFTAEYCLKVYSVNEDPSYEEEGPIFGRLAYMSTFPALADLFAFLPYWILTTGLAGNILPGTLALREVVNAFSLLRLLKFERKFR